MTVDTETAVAAELVKSGPGEVMHTPERMITVWCPDWPVIAAGCRADVPAAVMRAHRVVARTAAAAAEGIVIGQRRRQAQQRCPQIVLLDDDPARDAREFEPVVRAVGKIAPRVDLVEPGWLTVAARGPSKYFGGDAAVGEHLQQVVIGVLADVLDEVAADQVGIGVADGRFAASIAARLGVRRKHPVVVDSGGSPEFCAPLPIGWLQTLGEVDADLVDLFVRLGVRCLGAFAALTPSDVLGRFGPVGLHAHRLAAGADIRPANTTDPAPERRLARVLDDPAAQTDSVVFVAKQLADELAGSLGADGRVCTRLVVLLETEHGERSQRSWYRSAGMSAPAMVERVRWQLDAWVNLPRGSENEVTGGVTFVRITPEEVRADTGVQLGLWGGQSDADRRAVRAVARLTSLTSEAAVTVPVWHGGRLPADRYRWMPATLVDLDQRERAVSRTSTGAGLDGRSGPWPGCLPAPSPSTVFDSPLPLEVLDGEGAAVRVSGRGMVSAAPSALRLLRGSEADGWRRGALRSVRSWAGPWPVDQQWWEPDQHRRLARFQVVVEDAAMGEQAHLVIAEHQRWFLLATYR
ncbi:MAG: DNA polymerase Y family protein [Ilumatobacter sp.]